MNEDNHSSTSKKATITLAIIGVIIIIGIIGSKIQIMSKEVIQLQKDKVILEMNPLQGKYVGVNKNQIIKVTNDGVRAYDLNGQEIWSDTLTLESIWVQQKEPYFSISSKNGRKLSIFNDKGKQGEITMQSPIIYTSINENGQVAIIEETKEGHKVSAYTSKGEFIAYRGSYISSGVFPIAAEVSPDGKVLLISYLGVSGSKVISTVEAISLEKADTGKPDNVLYAMQELDNIIYEIEFLNDNEWVTIGDKSITFYNIEGERLKTISGLYITYTPYLYKRGNMGGYLPVLATNSAGGNIVHSKETLYLFDKLGEEVAQISFDMPVSYFYADSKGVIVAEGNKYKGYNKLGNQYFEYQASQDLNKLVYLNNEAVAISKDKVILLKPKRNK